MADIAHGRDDLATSSQSASENDGKIRFSRQRERHGQPPRTDVGTLTLHWVTAIAFIVSLFTGIRIAGGRAQRAGLALAQPDPAAGRDLDLALPRRPDAVLLRLGLPRLRVARRARQPQRAEEDARDGDAGRRARCASAASTCCCTGPPT